MTQDLVLLERLAGHGDWFADTEYVGARVTLVEELNEFLDLNGGISSTYAGNLVCLGSDSVCPKERVLECLCGIPSGLWV